MKFIQSAFALALVLSFLNCAQASSDIEEVLVSASLVPVNKAETATAFTVIDQQYLEHRAPTLLSEVLRDVPGLAVNRSGVVGSNTQIRVRGAEANHVLVLIDGVEANDPSQNDELNWATFPATDIERIEIIRGPQSALYGSDAMAGVINVITRTAEKPFSAGFFTEAGSFGTYNNGVNIGSKGQNYDIRLGASHLETDGDNISRIGNEEDGYRSTAYTLNSSMTPIQGLKLGFAVRQNEGQTAFDNTDDFTGLPGDANSYTDFLAQTLKLSADYEMLNGRWQHKLVYGQTKNDNDNVNASIKSTSNESTKQQFQYLSSLNWLDKTQVLSMLFEREEEDFKQRGAIQFGYLDPNQDHTKDTNSLVVEYRGTFMEKFTLGLSTRYDDNSEFDNAETYRAEISYHLTENTRLRSAWGTGVKNPTFSERFGYYTNFIGNPNLQPEESENWEAGIDQTLFDGRLQVGLTWFNAELEDEIDGFVFDPVTFGFTAENTDGTSKRQGVELAFDASLADTLTLQGSYTYMDSTEKGASGNETDEIRRPRHIGSLTLAWQALDNLQLNINTQFNGNQTDYFFPPPTYERTYVELDDYTLVNLNATYNATDRFDIYLRLENVLDEDYEEVFGYQTLGFGGYLGVRYNFTP